MTTCIAARTFLNDVVCVTDRKMSFQYTSNDGTVFKTETLGSTWEALIAGDDASVAATILRRASQTFEHAENSLESVVTLMKQAYSSVLSDRAADEYLARFKMDMEHFRTNGRSELGDTVFQEFCDKISMFKLKCRFLVAGHDASQRSHIFTISNPGIEEVWDRPGFWAIGNGATLALSTLALRGQSWLKTLPETIYNVLEAKFASEPATDVGEKTFCLVLRANHPGEWFWLTETTIQKIRSKWQKEGRPKLPKGILEYIKSECSKQWDDNE